MSTISSEDAATFIQLYKASLIPLRVILASLVWVLYDYLLTLEDEVRYIWTQNRNFGRFMFFWVRYFTIFLLVFDTLQIHTFAIPGVASLGLGRPAERVLGGISLWSVEIIMQIRIYVLYNKSKKVLVFNGVLFLASIGSFLWLVTVNAVRRNQILHQLHEASPLPGCPVVNGGTEWAQWIPGTLFEGVLFMFALHRAARSVAARTLLNQRLSITAILINENILYFSVVSCILVFNNLMVIGKTKIPWFGFGPFHAAVGIVTCRVLIHLRKFAAHRLGKESTLDITKLDTTVGSSVMFREGGDYSSVAYQEVMSS